MNITEMKNGLESALSEIRAKHGNIRGLHGQENSHGAGEYSFNVFVPDTKRNRGRFPNAQTVMTGSLAVV